MRFNYIAQRFMILFGISSFASRSDALVNAGVSFGQKKLSGAQTFPVEGDLGNMNGTSSTIDAHIQPLALIPVSLGAFYAADKVANNTSDSRLAWSQNTGGLSVYTSIPVMITTLYMKLGWDLFGSSAVKVSGSDSDKAITGISESSFTKGKITGYRIGTGIAYPILPLTSLSLSYTYVRETHSFRELESIRFGDGSVVSTNLDDTPVRVNVVGSTMAFGLSVNL